MVAAPERTASSRRAAAFPVGAAERDEGWPASRRARLRLEERQDTRHRGRLARTRTTGHHGHPAQDRCRRRHALEVRAIDLVEQLRQVGRQPGDVDPECGRSGALEQVRCDLALVGPEAVQVQVRPFEM